MPSEKFSIQPDVRFKQYIGQCPGCGRVRLQLFVDGPEDDERCVGLECEKCHRQWLLDPEKADFYGEYDDRNPLHPVDDNNPFGDAP
jgi:hypothetical protein